MAEEEGPEDELRELLGISAEQEDRVPEFRQDEEDLMEEWDYLPDDYFTAEEREELKRLVTWERKIRKKQKIDRSLSKHINRSDVVIGRGSYGVVLEGIDSQNGEIVAVKEVDAQMRPKAMAALQKEMETLRELNHPNIVRYKGMEYHGHRLSLFMEFCPGGSISNVLDTFGALSYSNARSYTFQIVCGLDYLHRHSVVHRDVKCANCLLSSHGVVKLADFGAAQQLDKATSYSLAGTARYLAPEIIDGRKAGRKSDIWSLGCCVVEMFTLSVPFADQFSTEFALLKKLATLEQSPKPPESMPREARDFVEACYTIDENKRPSTRALRKFAFIEGMCEDYLANRSQTTSDSESSRDNQAEKPSAAPAAAVEKDSTEDTKLSSSKTKSKSSKAKWNMFSTSRKLNKKLSDQDRMDAVQWLKKLSADGTYIVDYVPPCFWWPFEHTFSSNLETSYASFWHQSWRRRIRKSVVIMIVSTQGMLNTASFFLFGWQRTNWMLDFCAVCIGLCALASISKKETGSARSFSRFQFALHLGNAWITFAALKNRHNSLDFLMCMSIFVFTGTVMPRLVECLMWIFAYAIVHLVAVLPINNMLDLFMLTEKPEKKSLESTVQETLVCIFVTGAALHYIDRLHADERLQFAKHVSRRKSRRAGGEDTEDREGGDLDMQGLTSEKTNDGERSDSRGSKALHRRQENSTASRKAIE